MVHLLRINKHSSIRLWGLFFSDLSLCNLQIEKALPLGLRFQPKSQAKLEVSLNLKPQSEPQACKPYGPKPKQTHVGE